MSFPNDFAIGVIFTSKQEVKWVTITYENRKLRSPELSYLVHECELFNEPFMH